MTAAVHTFTYTRAASLREAVVAMRKAAWGVYLSGGMTLVPILKHRLSAPAEIVDIGSLAELRGIRLDGDGIEIGALANHARVAASPDVVSAIPALAALAGGIGDPQVRNRGTLGGALATNDPAAEYPAAVLALNATIVTDRRTIAAEEFFRGAFETALARDELITAVRFPVPQQAGYAKFNRGASRYPLAGVFVTRSDREVRVAIIGARSCVFRDGEMEARLQERFSSESLDGFALDPDGMNDDLHASAGYRAHLAVIMARRAIAAASR